MWLHWFLDFFFYLLLKWISNQDNSNRKKKKLRPKWHHRGQVRGRWNKINIAEDGDKELKNGEKPEVLPEPGFDPHQHHGRLQEEAAKETKQNKTKTILPTHGTDSAHHAPLFLVPDMTLKESNFSITEFPDHIVFPFGLLLKQLFTTSVNTLEKSVSIQPSYLDYVFPAFPHFCFFNTGKMVQILIMFWNSERSNSDSTN